MLACASWYAAFGPGRFGASLPQRIGPKTGNGLNDAQVLGFWGFAASADGAGAPSAVASIPPSYSAHLQVIGSGEGDLSRIARIYAVSDAQRSKAAR